MDSFPSSDSLGTGMGTAASYGRLLCEIGAAAWKASARLSRWAAGARTAPGPQRGAAPAAAGLVFWISLNIIFYSSGSLVVGCKFADAMKCVMVAMKVRVSMGLVR